MRYLLLLCLGAYSSSLLADIRQGYTKQLPPRELTQEQTARAAANYKKLCALCHGDDRQGYANDHAPSLRSKSLFESGIPHSILRPISYGREGTAMAGYLDEIGGPLSLDDIWNLTYWLYWKSGAERVQLTENPVRGDDKRGGVLYQTQCATCHGNKGQGAIGPALWNPSFLAHNKDEFIRYAIRHGRDGTQMPAFQGRLSEQDINNLTAFLRSKADNTVLGQPVIKTLPTAEQYILNPNSDNPKFQLKDGKYVMAKDLYQAMQQKKRMVLLDTRVTSVWQRAHLAGSVPIPYYSDVSSVSKLIPKDVQIVAYCSCPRAASDYFVKKLTEVGYRHTAVMWEGIFGWIKLGYPVVRGELVKEELDQVTQAEQIAEKIAKAKSEQEKAEKLKRLQEQNIIEWCYYQCKDSFLNIYRKLMTKPG